MEVKFKTCLAISWFVDSISKHRFAELEEMEVENAIQHKISVLGLNALHEQQKLLV